MPTPERRGLCLRPPRRLLHLLHLIKEHAAAVAFRPISFGNRGYLEERVRELLVLAEETKALLPALNQQWRAAASRIVRCLATVSPDLRKPVFAQIVRACDQTGYRQFWEQAVFPVPLGSSLPVKKSYDRLMMVIGPGIGLGDEITCAGLIRDLRTAFTPLRFDILSYYPDLWQTLEPAAHVHALAGRPMRAMDWVDEIIDAGDAAGVLLLFINFSGLHFHLAFSLDRVKPDIAEIAVGRGCLWFAPASGGPVRVGQVLDPLYPSNYAALRRLSRMLVGKGSGSSPQRDESTPGLVAAEIQLLLSPFTSKQILLGPHDWVEIICRTLARVPRRKPVRCLVLPGMSDQATDYARRIVAYARQRTIVDFTIDLLEAPSPSSSAFEQVFAGMRRSHLLIGIDTFTSHLAALVGVPAVSLCHERNVAFWPEGAHSFWIEISHDLETITELCALVFTLAGGMRDEGAARTAGQWRAHDFVRLADTIPLLGANEPAGCTPRIISGYDAAWTMLPAPCQRLLERLDYNYAWPRLHPWLTDSHITEEAFSWLFEVLARSHFRKVIRLLVHFGRHAAGLAGQ